MVRVEERPWRGGTTVLLDRRGPAHRGHGPNASLEWAVSFCGSVCLHLHHCGQQVRLVAEDSQMLVGDNPETAHSDDVLLDALAMLRPTQRRELACGVDPGGGHELIAIMGSMTATEAAELSRVRTRRSRSLAVLLDVSGWAVPGEGAAHNPHDSADVLRDAGWGVVVASQEIGLAEAWTELCRIGAVRGGMRQGGFR